MALKWNPASRAETARGGLLSPLGVGALASAILLLLAACGLEQAGDTPAKAPVLSAPDALAAATTPGYELFVEKDQNRDGVLDLAELKAGLGTASEDEATRMFTALDRNGDGQLAIAEYFPEPTVLAQTRHTSHQADRTAP